MCGRSSHKGKRASRQREDILGREKEEELSKIPMLTVAEGSRKLWGGGRFVERVMVADQDLGDPLGLLI